MEGRSGFKAGVVGLWLGRSAFAAGLCAWVVLSLRQLPYGYHDVHYMLSLEWGLWGPSEWVHALFVPFLAGYRWVLGLFGFSGQMFLPTEYLNVGLGAAALAFLYRAGERLGGGPWAAGASALLLGFSQGFWEGALRCDPYAAAAFCTAMTLFLLADAGARQRRFAAAGVFAGLTACFHASALSLAPVGLLAAWREGPGAEGGRGSRRKALAFRFLAGMALSIAFGYAVFSAYHGVGLGYFKRMGSGEMFSKVEQIPGTSLWTSRSPAKQARDYANTLIFSGAQSLLALGALFVAWALIRGRLKGGLDEGRGRALWVGVSNLLFFSLFFLINNSQNGFVYGALVGLPPAIAASAGGWAQWLAAPAAAFAAVKSSRRELPSGPARDPIYVETRFLHDLLKPGDVLVLPGCPFTEVHYERRLNILPAAPADDGGGACLLPSVGLDGLAGRVEHALEQGRKVYFAGGDVDVDFKGLAGDIGGAQKRRQLFWSGAGTPEERAAAERAVRGRLSERFRLECVIRSPQGWGYCALKPKPGKSREANRAGGAAPPASLKSMGRGDVSDLVESMARSGAGLSAMIQARYLAGWLAEAPGDLYAKQDLIALALEAGGNAPWAQTMRASSEGRAASRAMSTFVGELGKASTSVLEAGAACAELDAGRAAEALRRWGRAGSACPACLDRLGGGGARGLEGLRRACAGRPWPSLAGWLLIGRYEDARRLLDEAASLFAAGRRLESARLLAKVRSMGPSDAMLWKMKGLHRSLGQNAEALAALDRLQERHPRDPAVRLERGQVLMELGRVKDALASLAEAERLGPADEDWEGMAAVYRSAKEPARALAMLDQAVKRKPKNGPAQVERGQVLAELGRRKDALAAYDAAVATGLAPAELRRAAWGYQSLDECGRAVAAWESLVKRPDAAGKDYSDKAVCEFRLGRMNQSVADLKKAIELAPAGLEAYVSLGAVYAKQGELKKALEAYDRGLAAAAGAEKGERIGKGGETGKDDEAKKGNKALVDQLKEGRALVLKRLGAR